MKDKQARGRFCFHSIFMVIGLLGAMWPCFGQTLMDVYQKARTQDAQYAAARKAFEAALEKLPQARAGLLPSVNVTANSSQQVGEASFSYAPYVERDVQSWSWTAQITQPLIRFGNWAQYMQADASVTQAKEQFALSEQELMLRSAQAYLDVLVAAESVRVMDAQLQAMNEQLTLAERTFAVGTGTITDVHEAKAKQALSLAQRIAALSDLETKQAELEKLVGGAIPVSPKRLAQDLPAMSVSQLDDWLALAATQNLQVKIQQAALEVAQKEVAKSASAHLPTLDAVLSRSANFGSGSLSSPADMATRVHAQQVGLQLNIPLFAGGATQSKVRESLAFEEKAREELIGARRNAGTQVRQAYAGMSNGQAQIAALRAAVDAGRNSVESNKIGFRIGTRINPDVLNAEQQLYATMRDLSKAHVETVMHGLKLKAAAGTLQADDLMAVDQLLGPLAEISK